MDNWLRRRIRRSAQLSLWLWGAGAALVLWIVAANLRGWIQDLQSQHMEHAPIYWCIAAALAALLWCAWMLRIAVAHLQDATSHRVWRRAAQWGDPDLLAAEIEREAQAPLLKLSGWLFCQNYLIKRRGVEVLRWRDLLWAHKHVTRHSINFIPTGKTYKSMFYWMDTKIAVDANQKKVDASLACAGQRAPWAVLGYSDQVAALYPRKKKELQAAVEQRYQQWAQQNRMAAR